MITALAWLWSQPSGRASFTAEHVNIWADSFRRHCSLDHEIACVTDMWEGIDPSIRIIQPPHEFEDVTLPRWGGHRPQCLRRLSMFRPDAADIFGERILCMDLDCVIGADLNPLFKRPDDFVMFRGTAPNRPYNGSMILMTAGARPKVYSDFTPAGAIEAGQKFVGSDQAWISHCLGWGEPTWGPEDGAVSWGRESALSAKEWRVVFFPGNPKPWDVRGDNWIETHWRRNDEWDWLEIEQRGGGKLTAAGGR